VAAAKALDTYKAQSKAGKAVVFMTKGDAAKEIDGKTVHNLRHWVQVRKGIIPCACRYELN
jgi:hypothetical protein